MSLTLRKVQSFKYGNLLLHNSISKFNYKRYHDFLYTDYTYSNTRFYVFLELPRNVLSLQLVYLNNYPPSSRKLFVYPKC